MRKDIFVGEVIGTAILILSGAVLQGTTKGTS